MNFTGFGASQSNQMVSLAVVLRTTVCAKASMERLCSQAALRLRGQSPGLEMARPGPDLGDVPPPGCVTCALLPPPFSLQNSPVDTYLTGCLGGGAQREPSLGFGPSEPLWAHTPASSYQDFLNPLGEQGKEQSFQLQPGLQPSWPGPASLVPPSREGLGRRVW